MPTYTRDLTSYDSEQRKSYESLYSETVKLFKDKVESVTVVHTMMIDRFVSTYIDLLSLDDVKTVSEKKYKLVQDKFQSWSKTIMDALHSSSLEAESKREFYEKVKDILTEEIPDDKLRKRIFERVLAEAVKK